MVVEQNTAAPGGAASRRKGGNGKEPGLDRLLECFAKVWQEQYDRPLMVRPHWRRLASQLLRSRPPAYPPERYVDGLLAAAEAYVESRDPAACRTNHDFGNFFRQAHAYLPAPEEL